MQAIWSGTISFSLVAIPVQLVKAVEPGRISFRMLHRSDYAPLARKMLCPQEDRIVPADEIIRGYEIGPDKYIVVTDEELESVTPERSRTIEIVEFVDIRDIDSIYYDQPYYLVPSKGGEKAYRLLAEVMGRTNRAGLAKFVLGEREYPVAIMSADGALSLITLHYSEEILADDSLAPKNSSVEPAEIDRMKKTIMAMSADFKPQKYADERRKKMVAVLEKKIKEEAPVEAPEIGETEGEGPIDLVAILQESMRKVKENK
ncbi:MAG: putative DNA repair protein YkoV [Syntrophorhabdus sp. PtaU1.Bin153]|nr:MAG: putative DNA repair protein YkoV [Syntrophorhabdus sp. PtaU1.Bin153]